jgi:hypothetical protein
MKEYGNRRAILKRTEFDEGCVARFTAMLFAESSISGFAEGRVPDRAGYPLI